MKIKKLVWISGHAETPWGFYKLYSNGERYTVRYGDWSSGWKNNETEAVLAAQADFEKRVKECIEPEPVKREWTLEKYGWVGPDGCYPEPVYDD